MEHWMTLDGKGGLLMTRLTGGPAPTEEEKAQFFKSLGEASSAWQGVETSLYSIASSAVQAHNSIGLGLMFHSQPMYRARLESVHAMVPETIGLSEATKDEWQALYKKLTKGGKDRNRFLHGQTFFDPTRKEGVRLFISGNFWSFRNWGKIGQNGDGITAAKLAQLSKEFFQLQNDVWAYSGKVSDELTPPTNALKSFFDSQPWGGGTGMGLLKTQPSKLSRE